MSDLLQSIEIEFANIRIETGRDLITGARTYLVSWFVHGAWATMSDHLTPSAALIAAGELLQEEEADVAKKEAA